MTDQSSTSEARITGLVILVAALLAFSLLLKFIIGFKTGVILSEVINWLQSLSVAQIIIDNLRRYGAYAVANVELIALCFLLIPTLRRIGAGLGLLFAGVTLLIYLLVSLKTTAWITELGPLYAGGSVALMALFALTCLLLLRASKVSVSLDERSQSWKHELKQELEKEAMETTPIVDYTELSERISFHTAATEEVEEAYKQLLLDVTRELRDVIEGDHHRALVEAQKNIETLPSENKYFPRQPMIIPKLIRAVNSEDSTKERLVKVISQDPVIAGELLRMANSPYYKLSEGTIDSIGRAILVLGIDGLRLLTSTLVLQPVAQTDKTYFPGFTKRVWLQSVLAANAAQAYARKTRSCDSFTAHLLGLLSSIGHIVIFQMLLDVYKNYSGVHPKIEVLNQLQRGHADNVSAAVIQSWNLSEEFVDTLKAYQLQGDVNDLSPLARALYYGRLCATLHTLHEKGRYDMEQVQTVLREQGLHDEVFEAMWKVLTEGEQSLSEVWG